MSTLTLLYDPECGLCRRVQGWLAEQPKFDRAQDDSDQDGRRAPALSATESRPDRRKI